MATLSVGVVRGGTADHHTLSLSTGRSVLEHLPQEQYIPRDIVISKDGLWHMGGVVLSHERIVRQLDVVFNALHGSFGEDGSVQHLFQTFGVPYTGSRVFPSMMGMHKHFAREVFIEHGLNVPLATFIKEGENGEERARELFNRFPLPAMVKPAASGSSLGSSLAGDFAGLLSGIAHAREYSLQVLVEEYIKGTDASCVVIENFRGEETYVCPPVEIALPPQSAFYDTYAKYGAETSFHCPARFDKEVKNGLMAMARTAHEALGLRHYSRVDFVVHPRRGIYILEVNTLPELTPDSIIANALEAIGSGLPEFLDHVIGLALKKA